MLAILAPGQGAQKPGMLIPWLERTGAGDRLTAFSEASGLDLERHGTASPADTIRDTSVAQPLIVATGLLALEALLDGRPASETIGVSAGHSVGEFTAAAAAGVMDERQAIALVTARAAFMAQASQENPSGMAAVVGGDPDEVDAAIRAAGLWPANVNGGGQVVAAGPHEGLAALAANPPAKARVVPLAVAGAFHTPLMASAAARLEEVAAEWTAHDPVLPLLSNADGLPFSARARGAHGHGSRWDVLRSLVAQITSPVRWDLCQQTLADLGVTAIIELAPAGVLTGLARRTLPGIPRVALTSPADLEPARELLDAATAGAV